MQKARTYFPRGLNQPDGSFRFSVDALLLASFVSLPDSPLHSQDSAIPTLFSHTHKEDDATASVASHNRPLLADLGTGCGVVAFGMLLRFPSLLAIGLDKEPLLLESACVNAAQLHLHTRFAPLCHDLAAAPEPEPSEATSPVSHFASLRNACDIVLANPPYRIEGHGRLPRHPLRRTACFGTVDTLRHFCMGAAHCLAHVGILGMIMPWERCDATIRTMCHTGLHVRRILPIISRHGQPPTLVLLEAGRTPVPNPLLEPPLVLYSQEGASRGLTPEALAFCPFLACNAQ